MSDDIAKLKAGLNPYWFEYTMADGRVAVIDRAITGGDVILAGHAGELALLRCISSLVKVDGKLLTTSEWRDMPFENSARVIQEVTKRLERVFGR